jgi:hypothetical protein
MDHEELDTARNELDAAHTFYKMNPVLSNLTKLSNAVKVVDSIIQKEVDDRQG